MRSEHPGFFSFVRHKLSVGIPVPPDNARRCFLPFILAASLFTSPLSGDLHRLDSGSLSCRPFERGKDVRREQARWGGKPAYRGMQGGGLTWSKMFSKEMIAQLDYVFSDALIFPDKDCRLLELWTQATAITDAKGFIERHVGFNLKVMDMELIDARASATFLSEYAVHGCGILGTEVQANPRERSRPTVRSSVAWRPNLRCVSRN
jgi:hypothetical protein